jgi:hypothetical protein
MATGKRAASACLAAVALAASTLLPGCARNASPAVLSTPSPKPLPVATGAYPTYGHAADFSWLAGRLQRGFSCTYLVFGPSARTPWAGRIPVVASPLQDDSLSDGDTVVLRGRLEPLSYGACGAPSYVVSRIEEH